MMAIRQRLVELDDYQSILFRALATEFEQLTEDLAVEASAPKVDLLAVSAASRDRRLVIELLRRYNLPPLSAYCSGPDVMTEEQLLREAVE